MEPYHLLEHILDGTKEPTNLPFALLNDITKCFSEEREIGHGGFAVVYKGVLPNGNVAVKRIRSSHSIDEKLFYREVNSLMMMMSNHQNIVRFLGFCASTDQTAIKVDGLREHTYAEIRERLLCFEYISNGSLQKYITDELKGLEWNTRYQIIKGICEGLHYVHNEKRIYHMDLKPANILLDDDMVPKITDFGLSRLNEKSQTMSVDRCGTLGYCAPEYQFNGKMSFKSDMYSLGTIIIELVTGDKSISDKNNLLRRWSHRWKKTGKETSLVYQQVTKFIEIGLLCQEIDPSKRPYIREIMRDINEMEGTHGQNSDANESTFGQISPYSEDDMLGIEPLKLHFPFELNKQMSRSVELTNDTDAYIAFNVQNMSPHLPYCTQPNKGVVLPRSKCNVDITLQPQDMVPRDMQCANEFIVWSTKVNDGLTAKDITIHMFNKETGNVVDEVNLDVIFDAQRQRELLGIHPLELRFPFEFNKLIPCSLHLTNKTDKWVAFKLMHKSIDRRCFVTLPMHGIVPPRSTYTLVASTENNRNIPEEREVDLVLQSSLCDDHIEPLTKEADCDRYFNKVKMLGYTQHNVTLKAVYAPLLETTCEAIPSLIKIISVDATNKWWNCLDANISNYPWILHGDSDGYVRIWNYDLKEWMGSARIPVGQVRSVKFVKWKPWILAGSSNGIIYAFNRDTMKIINSVPVGDYDNVCLAVHPTKPYLLSSSGRQIRLWDLDGWFGWRRMKTFSEHFLETDAHFDGVNQVAFNPNDTDTFASASEDRTVKVWSIDSRKSKYTLSGHTGAVTCLDFFTRDDQQYLITGSTDKTAKIWHMQTKKCVCTLGTFASPVTSVLSHRYLPFLITSTSESEIHLWSSINFRLKRIIKVGHRFEGWRLHLACFMEPRRVLIGHDQLLSVIEINDENTT